MPHCDESWSTLLLLIAGVERNPGVLAADRRKIGSINIHSAVNWVALVHEFIVNNYIDLLALQKT